MTGQQYKIVLPQACDAEQAHLQGKQPFHFTSIPDGVKSQRKEYSPVGANSFL